MKTTTKNLLSQKIVTRLLSIVLILAATINFSCSNDSRISSSDTKELKQEIFILPDSYPGQEPQVFFTSDKNVYREPTENAKITVRYKIGDNYIPINDMGLYINNLIWDVGKDTFTIYSFLYLFNEPGLHFCILKSIDNFMDTLIDTVNIFVNTPESIKPIYPSNGNNQINPFLDKTQSFQWETSGIDPWEESYCAIYEALKPEKVWDNLKKEISCNEIINIYDIIRDDIEKRYDYEDEEETYTFYWGVKLFTRNETKKINETSSEIFHFTTKLQNKNYSIIKIPIVYDYTSSISSSPNTNIIITSSHGDTLYSLHNNKKVNTVYAKITPQSGLIVHVSDSSSTEFRPKTFSIDIPEQTVVQTDTVYLQDKTPPTIWPISSVFPKKDQIIQFSIIDGGVEKSAYSTEASIGDSVIVSTYYYPIFTIKVPQELCEIKCDIDISATDYAGNWTGITRWTLTNKKSNMYLSGPKPILEE